MANDLVAELQSVRRWIGNGSRGAVGMQKKIDGISAEIERLRASTNDRAVAEASALLGELLDGPSKGGFYGIDTALRSKLETIRLTLQRATTNDAPVERLVDAAYFLLSEIDASNDAEHIKGASGPLRAALAAITTAPTAPVDREAAKQALRRWHRDTCYPNASDGELEIGLDAIVSLLPNIPEGWVAVPREPTEAMVDAAVAAQKSGLSPRNIVFDAIAASPGANA